MFGTGQGYYGIKTLLVNVCGTSVCLYRQLTNISAQVNFGRLGDFSAHKLSYTCMNSPNRPKST